MVLYKSVFLHVRVKVLSPMGNIWIGDWAIFLQYMDPTLPLNTVLCNSLDYKILVTRQLKWQKWHRALIVIMIVRQEMANI